MLWQLISSASPSSPHFQVRCTPGDSTQDLTFFLNHFLSPWVHGCVSFLPSISKAIMASTSQVEIITYYKSNQQCLGNKAWKANLAINMILNTHSYSVPLDHSRHLPPQLCVYSIKTSQREAQNLLCKSDPCSLTSILTQLLLLEYQQAEF